MQLVCRAIFSQDKVLLKARSINYFSHKISLETNCHQMAMGDCSRSDLDIAIVGAGIAGLTSAIALLLIQDGTNRRITVLEKYSNCQPTFSGPVQLHTNATRVLAKYGVAKEIEACLPELRSVHNIHRFSDGHLLYNLPVAVSQKNYKSPYVT